MNRSIRLHVGELELTGELNDTPTARGIWDALPLERAINTWGDEWYFDIGVGADLDPDATDVVDAGTLAYWPPGQAFCVFFGPTPASLGDEIRAASAVNTVGALHDVPAAELRAVQAGTTIRIEQDA